MERKTGKTAQAQAERAKRIAKKQAIADAETKKLYEDYQLIYGATIDASDKYLVLAVARKNQSEAEILGYLDAIILLGISYGKCRTSILTEAIAKRRKIKAVKIALFLKMCEKHKIVLLAEGRENLALRGGKAAAYIVNLDALDLLKSELAAKKKRLSDDGADSDTVQK